MSPRRKKPPTPAQRVEAPDATYVKDGRCGRWKRDGYRTRRGEPTRKQEAVARAEAGEEPEALIVEYRDAGARCRLPASEPGAPCARYHGGATPRGPDNANWKHGATSAARMLPQALLVEYERALRDPARFAYSRQIAAQEALLSDAFTRLDSKASAAIFRQAAETLAQLNALARQSPPDRAAIARLGARLNDLLADGVEQETLNERARKDAIELLAEQRRTAAAEFQRRQREELLVSIATVRAQDARLIDLMIKTFERGQREYPDVADPLGRVMGWLVEAYRAEQQRWIGGVDESAIDVEGGQVN